MNLQLAVSKSLMFPLPTSIDGTWLCLDRPPTWSFVRFDETTIQIGVANTVVSGKLQRHGSILTIRLEGSKPLVAYASLQDGILELTFVTHQMRFRLSEIDGM